MPCTNQASTPQRRNQVKDAIARLDAALTAGSAQVVIGQSGAIAFKGWSNAEGVSDLCAYRALAATNSPALRRAIARAEVVAGRTLDARALAAGTHSHDGGATWSTHT